MQAIQVESSALRTQLAAATTTTAASSPSPKSSPALPAPNGGRVAAAMLAELKATQEEAEGRRVQLIAVQAEAGAAKKVRTTTRKGLVNQGYYEDIEGRGCSSWLHRRRRQRLQKVRVQVIKTGSQEEAEL